MKDLDDWDIVMSLIEKNALILATLEDDWSELGAVRQINFAVRYVDSSNEQEDVRPVSEEVDEFVAAARAEGCECETISDQFGDWTICVSKRLKPDAGAITSLQEKLIEITHRHTNNTYVDGWHYPPKRTITYWPEPSKADRTALDDRLSVLFDGALVEDPIPYKRLWQESKFGRVAVARDFLGSVFGHRSEEPNIFKLVPSQFLKHAERNRPSIPEPTVSAFSQWIYSLYSSQFGDEEDREEGKKAEQEIWQRRGEALNSITGNYLRANRPSWELIHNGLHIDERSERYYFSIPSLRVNGNPLRASPDLMFLNRETSDAIIVETKFTHMPIPKNLWPNIWGQLWCYSQIDVAARANNLTVIGEIWGGTWSRGYGQGRKRSAGSKVVCLRASVRRNPRAPAYDRFFRSLFNIYAGQTQLR